MEMQSRKLELTGADTHYTQHPGDTYFVEEGIALVYLVPWKEGKPGRRLFLCQAEQGRMIPSFCFTDRNRQQWTFCLTPGETCRLLHRTDSATSILYRNFAARAGLEQFRQEGFEGALIERYQKEMLKDQAFIRRGEKNEPRLQEASDETIRRVFGEEKSASPKAGETQDREEDAASGFEGLLPDRELTGKDVLSFCRKSIGIGELLGALLPGLFAAGAGLALPWLIRKLCDEYLPRGEAQPLLRAGVAVGLLFLGALLFSLLRGFCRSRLGGRMGYDLQRAAIFRVFRLREANLRQHESVELARQLMEIAPLTELAMDTILEAVVALPLSLLCLGLMLRCSAPLFGAAMLLCLCGLAVLALPMVISLRRERDVEKDEDEAGEKLYQYLGGMEKIRIAGAEEHAVYAYLQPFARQQAGELKRNRAAVLSEAAYGTALAAAAAVLFFVAARQGEALSPGDYLAFHTVFGLWAGIMGGLLSDALALFRSRKRRKEIMALLCAAPEDTEDGEDPGSLSGEISFEGASFSYGPGEPEVLKEITFSIHPGEYIGIVGASGSGKSTLLKLLLGLETPGSGKVLYDGRDLRTLNKHRLRKQLGVVLQDGKLIPGSISENILIAAPLASAEEVERVVDLAGLREEIDRMPMGMQTLLSESNGAISGGQKQRILLARALIGRPAVLVLDEATGALDDLSQAAICKRLEGMKLTRVVVAHRLSTIRPCDRVLVLDGGRIAEEGSYEELMARKGLFYQLANRQAAEG